MPKKEDQWVLTLGACSIVAPHICPFDNADATSFYLCSLYWRPTDYDQLAGVVEPDQIKSVLADIDTDDGKLFEASCFLCTHGYFSWLHG